MSQPRRRGMVSFSFELLEALLLFPSGARIVNLSRTEKDISIGAFTIHIVGDEDCDGIPFVHEGDISEVLCLSDFCKEWVAP